MRPGGGATATFLIVEDDAGLARTLARVLHRYECVLTHTLADALTTLDQHAQLTAAIVDVVLPDGSGFDVLAAIRARSASMPVLVLTGHKRLSFVNRVHKVGGAQLAFKPFDNAGLLHFAEGAVLAMLMVRHDAEGLAAHHGARLGLSRRECHVLELALRRVSRADMADALGISEHTIKVYVHALLEKTGDQRLADLVKRLWRGEHY